MPVNAAPDPFPAPARRVKAELLAPDPSFAQEARRLVELTQARRALAAITSVPEALAIVTQARALHYYLQQRRESEALIHEAMEINLRASRRAGEILLATEKHKGAATPSHDESASLPTLEEMGIDRNQSSRLQRLARIPEPQFEAYLAETKAAHGKLSANGLIRHFQALERQEKRATEAGPERGVTVDAIARPSAGPQDETAPPYPSTPASDPRPAIADAIVTRVMDYVHEALAETSAAAVQAGFEQAMAELRRRIAALPCLTHHERNETPGG